MEMLKFFQLMKKFMRNEDIVGDLMCLQTHFRVCIQIHQELSQHLYYYDDAKKINETKSFNLIRDFMDVLEDEMVDLSEKQKILVNTLNERITNYYDSLTKKAKKSIDLNSLKGFVNQQIDYRRYFGLKFSPKNIKLRITEADLLRKFDKIKEQIRRDEEIKLKSSMQPILEPILCNSLSVQVSSSTSMFLSSPDICVQEKKPNLEIPVSQTITLNEGENDKVNTIKNIYEYQAVLESKEKKLNRKSPKNNRKKKKIKGMLTDIKKNLLPSSPENSPIKNPTKEQFLRMFGLIPNSEAQCILSKKRKRRQRSCVKNLRKDFHYGNFSLKDVKMQINRSKMSIKKKSY